MAKVKSDDGSFVRVPGSTPCVVLPEKYAYRWGLSRIEGGWAVFHAGKRYEVRCRARLTTIAQVPDLAAALVSSEHSGWRWTEIRTAGEERPERFELLELDDESYDDEQGGAPPDETVLRFHQLELD